MPHWEHFPHQSDIGVRGVGASPADAFEQAGIALTAVMSDPATVEPRELVTVACEAPDIELLFVEWLDRLIYEGATRKMLFGRFAVRIEGLRLQGRAWGEPIDPTRHPCVVEVKGATLTSLHVTQGADGLWTAQCVVDV
jgi:SHS2 domain-containing protein